MTKGKSQRKIAGGLQSWKGMRNLVRVDDIQQGWGRGFGCSRVTEVSRHWKLNWLSSQANNQYLLEERAGHFHAVVLNTSKNIPLRQHVAVWEITGYV